MGQFIHQTVGRQPFQDGGPPDTTQQVKEADAKGYGKRSVSDETRKHMGNQPVAFECRNQGLNLVGFERCIGQRADSQQRSDQADRTRFDEERMTESKSLPVLIVGAGIAGISTALENTGQKVIVFIGDGGVSGRC